MFARFQTVRLLPFEGREEGSRRLVDAVRTHAGFEGIYLVTQIGGPAGACLTLWGTRQDAEAAADRTQAQLGARPFPLASDDVYEVIDCVRHNGSPDDSAVVNLVWLDGPRSAEQQAADEVAATRIKKAIDSVDGLTVDYVLRREDGAQVVAAFARTVEALEAAGHAIMISTLLPSEDPALLTGPDRTMICRVASHALASGAA